MFLRQSNRLAGITIRQLAAGKLEAAIADKQLDVQLSAETVESLSFLLWRHVEHYLMFSSAALASTPSTPYQVEFFRFSEFSIFFIF